MEIDNSIMVERDYDTLRNEFLESITDEKVKGMIETLGDYRYYYPQLFPVTTGWGVRKYIKYRVKMIKSAEGLLEKLLYDGEEVRFMTSGIYSSFFEQYFLGIFSQFINKTVFIFTNFRVIMLNVDTKLRPLQMKWHVPYDQINKFKIGAFFASAVFKLKDKKKFTFSSIPKKDRKVVTAYVREMMDRAEKESFNLPHFKSRDNLCTECCQPVEPDTYECKQCNEEFIHPSKPALLSLCFPCLGDLYMGHRLLGFFELLGALMLWLVIIVMIAEEGLAALPVALILIIIGHGVDAAVTYKIGKKGLVSKKKAWRSH